MELSSMCFRPGLMKDKIKLEKDRNVVKTWLIHQIDSTKGELLTVKPKKFFLWLGRTSYSGGEVVKFWKLVKELAPQLGLNPVDSFFTNYKRKMVFIIESRICIQPQSNLE